MRTKIFIPIVFLVVSAFLSCSKLKEDPKATLTPGNYFQTQADLDAAVSAIYQGMVIDGAYAFDFHLYSFFGSDDLTADPNLGKADQRDFDQLNASSGNNAIAHSQWGTPWAAIYQSNNVIGNYQKVSGDQAAINGAAGQAYFVRAWSYYLLVRTFGPVPVITTQVGPDYRPARDSISTVYQIVVSDLKTAIGLLPTSFPGQPGKATQNSARSLLADVYLTMATWPLNETSNYALSAAEADSVIKSAQYSLVPDYATVFQTNNNSESIFGLEFNVSGGNPDRFFGDCSMPWEEFGLDGNFGWEEFYPEINFYKAAPVCKRTDEEFYTTLKLLQPDKTFLLVPYNSPMTRNQHPFYRKFRAAVNNEGCSETDASIISMNPSTNKTNDVIRYPEVLLDYAEASAMAENGPDATSYSAINLVRDRAGEPPLTPGLSATAFRDSVVFERAYEFAAEWGARWFDIVRLQLLPQVIAARSPLENQINPSVDIKTRYYAPIPVNEMLKNPQWTQNPGY
ncbi:MAG TPA: RagB/SusD family nutrient uptake outer membrane protein [Puia sp.]|nr:RagB/SusD family nutrient uptake outer membrane protein [Puia sp.]